MLETFFDNTFNFQRRNELNTYTEIVENINELASQFAQCSDIELRMETQTLKARLQENGLTTEIIGRSFALVREATTRVLSLRHYDVQLIGGLVLNDGKIAEMKTGEGKTIVALLPTFLNALYGKGVHVITVNDYLARRDAEEVGRVHKFLGLSVGLVQSNMTTEERKKNYNCDVVYVTNTELGFDYLRDNLALKKEDIVMRPFFYCVIDEIDSILIDEARTPLIISRNTEAPVGKYEKSTRLANTLQRNIHYLVDEKNQAVTLLDEGVEVCEQALNTSDLYDVIDPWIPYILNSLKAKELYTLNTHYIRSSDQKIIIVDEFTGRTMEDRRWADGLHQAVEAKENVPIQDNSETVASITYQNLFLMYKKLSGMTGTARTEELEFEAIYKLKTTTVPTHKPIKRKDFPDYIYTNQYFKWQAVAKECIDMHNIGRPVLIGTTSIEKSELLAALLNECSIPYRLLNAKPENIESEAEIIAQAGCLKAITISTNMAGRGTDILLGGNFKSLLKTKLAKAVKILFSTQGKKENFECELAIQPFVDVITSCDLSWFDREEILLSITNILGGEGVYDNSNVQILEDLDVTRTRNILKNIIEKLLQEQIEIQNEKQKQVVLLGGLHVIGTERHESRRIDNQLRGRAGRQGDKGSSRFFISLDDQILRLFGGNEIKSFMDSAGLQDGTPLQSQLLNRSLESAQKKIESYYFEARKQLFEYDQALNLQRNVLYTERQFFVQTSSISECIINYGTRSLLDIYNINNQNMNSEITKLFIFTQAQQMLAWYYPFELFFTEQDPVFTKKQLLQQFEICYNLKSLKLDLVERGILREIERAYLLSQIDKAWQTHLKQISALKESIGWRAYGQRDPLTEYKKEAYKLYAQMLIQIRHRLVYFIFRSKEIIT